MEFENKILSREIQENLYSTGKTLSTAESCTGGRIAESIIAVPGASDYFKGGIICYTNEIKERLLHVDPKLIEEKTAVCEEVAVSMVKGATQALNTDFAVAATGIAGPGGGTKDIPVGTIWLACGSKDKVITCKLEEDNGRDKNLAYASFRALILLKEFLDENNPKEEKDEDRVSPIGQI
ncbi:MAG: CinA family protein [Prevotella sp.]|nr:CinA family protein [Prevotella sp.]